MTSAYLSPVVPQIGDILSIIRAKLSGRKWDLTQLRPENYLQPNAQIENALNLYTLGI